MGMIIAAKISALQGFCSDQDVERLTMLLSSLDLPVNPPDFSLEEYVVSMQRDKKVKQGTLSLVLNRGIGEAVLQKITDTSSVFSSVLAPLRGNHD